MGRYLWQFASDLCTGWRERAEDDKRVNSPDICEFSISTNGRVVELF